MAAQRQESNLIRNITFWPLMGIAVGQIIGAGVMTMTGVAIKMTGTGVALAFILSSLITLISNIPTTIMGASVPTTGGAYRYVSRLRGKKFGLVYTVTYVVANLTIALYALSFATYIGYVFTGINERIIAALILVVFFCVNMVGAKQAAIINTLISAAMISGLLLFIGFGIPKTDYSFVFSPSNMFVNGPTKFLSALALLSFATGGAQIIAELGGEIVEPHKTIPKVMVISTVFVGCLYAMIAAIAAGVLPIEQVAGQNLAMVAEAIMPRLFFYFFILFAAGGATMSTLNATLSWVSKPILVACDDGILPKSLGTVNRKGVPGRILTIFFCAGIIPIIAGLDISFISKMGTAISLFNKLILCFAFMKLVDLYPEAVNRSVLKVTGGQAKAIGVSTMILNAVLSASLFLDLPWQALAAFTALVAAAAMAANSGYLKKVTILADLVVDYTTGGVSEKQ